MRSALAGLSAMERTAFVLRHFEGRSIAEICDQLGAQAARVTAAGQALQVEDDRVAAPIFVLRGRERRRVLWEGPDGYVLRGTGEEPRPVADLLAIIADNPAVAGEAHVRFYAGAPLKLSDGCTVGTLCVADRRPRILNEDQLAELRRLAALVVDELESPRL